MAIITGSFNRCISRAPHLTLSRVISNNSRGGACLPCAECAIKYSAADRLFTFNWNILSSSLKQTSARRAPLSTQTSALKHSLIRSYPILLPADPGLRCTFLSCAVFIFYPALPLILSFDSLDCCVSCSANLLFIRGSAVLSKQGCVVSFRGNRPRSNAQKTGIPYE